MFEHFKKDKKSAFAKLWNEGGPCDFAENWKVCFACDCVVILSLLTLFLLYFGLFLGNTRDGSRYTQLVAVLGDAGTSR